MATNIKKCKFSNPTRVPQFKLERRKLFPCVARPSPCGGGGGGGIPSCGRFKQLSMHLPALIVNDVVATESHFC